MPLTNPPSLVSVGDADTLDTLHATGFIKADGSVALAGDLQLGANKIKTTNLLFKEHDEWTTIIRNVADGSDRGLAAGWVNVSTSLGYWTSGGAFNAADADAAYVSLTARDTGGAMVETARLQGAADPYFQFTLPPVIAPTADPGAPVDGHVAHDGTNDMLRYYSGAAWRRIQPVYQNIPVFANVACVYTNPGTSYTEGGNTAGRSYVDFSKFKPLFARVTGYASFNEAGVTCGIEVYNLTNSAAICEWTGTPGAAYFQFAGSWTATTLAADVLITVRGKAGNATADLTLYNVHLECYG